MHTGTPGRLQYIRVRPQQWRDLRLRGVVLREVLVVIRVEDSLRRVALRKALRGTLAVDIILSATVAGEVGRL